MKLLIEGKNKLTGEIKVSGAKNAALKMIAAALLTNEEVVLKNIPQIIDVKKMAEIARLLGAGVKWDHNTLSIIADKIETHILPDTPTRSLRGSVVFVGALLARTGKATLPDPGGCAIGARPLTGHTDILTQLGVEITTKAGQSYFVKRKRPPSTVKLLERSVTATENALIYSALSDNTVSIGNVAAEPEIDDLIVMLNSMGAKIERISPRTIRVTGVSKLKGTTHQIMGDRIEAGTWMVAGLLLGDNLRISGFNSMHLSMPIKIAQAVGGNILDEQKHIIVSKSKLKATSLKTAVYPGFPTDLQSPFGLLLTQAVGRSIIYEALFSDRLKYLEQLNAMGAKTSLIDERRARIDGPTPLKGTIIESVDLRAGATVVLAGLIAEGQTVVEKAEIIDRGYEDIEHKLSAIGANIERIVD